MHMHFTHNIVPNRNRLAATRPFISKLNEQWLNCGHYRCTALDAHVARAANTLQISINVHISQCGKTSKSELSDRSGSERASERIKWSGVFECFVSVASCNLIKFVYTRVCYKLYLFSVFHSVVYFRWWSISVLSSDLEATLQLWWQLFCSIFWCQTNETITFKTAPVVVFRSFASFVSTLSVSPHRILALHFRCFLHHYRVSSCLFASLHDILSDTQIVKIIYWMIFFPFSHSLTHWVDVCVCVCWLSTISLLPTENGFCAQLGWVFILVLCDFGWFFLSRLFVTTITYTSDCISFASLFFVCLIRYESEIALPLLLLQCAADLSTLQRVFIYVGFFV